MAVKTQTRGQIITTALRPLNQNIAAESREFLDTVLDVLEDLGYWRFLFASTTHQTVNTQQSVLFSASEFPAAALTDYSKGVSVASDAFPYNLTQLSKEAFDKLADGTTGDPTHFALEAGVPGSEKLFLFPTPVTGNLPLLTIKYYKIINHPLVDTDNMQTGMGIPSKMNPTLIAGIRAEAMLSSDDPRWIRTQADFLGKVVVNMVGNDDFFDEKESRLDRSSLIEKVIAAMSVLGAGRG